MGKEGKKVPFLSDLGRANMRGLRKCKKCGTLNGTRGFACKNTSCDVIFKEDMPNKKSFNDISKLDSGSCRQIYSVRVRDKGPDYRGFVQLQTEISGDDLLLEPQTQEILQDDQMKCYIETCVKHAKNSVGVKSICKHLWSAQQCYKEAKTLILRNTSTHLIQIPPHLRNELWILATDSPGPLVQRVSKGVMVVKCKLDLQHPLGFLHLSFHQFRNRKDHSPNFFCGCNYFKQESSQKIAELKYCIHFYACIMAFASNDSLSEEFSYFINLVKSINNNLSSPEKANISLVKSVDIDDGCKTEVHIDERDDSSFIILNNNGPGTPCQVEVDLMGGISDEALTIPINATNNDIHRKVEIKIHTEESLEHQRSACGRIDAHQLPNNINLTNLKRKDDDSIITKQKTNSFSSKRVKEFPKTVMPISKKVQETDEDLTTFSFSSWLHSARERINQSMQYGHAGKPEALVFHIPKSFYKCLLERINQVACGKRKKCLVESKSFVIRDVIPCGTFMKLTWKLTNLSHVVSIFSTDEIPLQTVMYFTQEKNGKYISCDPPIVPKLTPGMTQGLAVRPHELKTILNVGILSSLTSKEPVPFIIEWISDILPQSDIGELRLKFEYIHCNNSHYVDQPGAVPSTIRQNRHILPLAPKIPANKIALPFSSSSDVIGLPVSQDFSPGDIAILTF